MSVRLAFHYDMGPKNLGPKNKRLMGLAFGLEIGPGFED